MHIVSQIRAACWRLEPGSAAAPPAPADPTVVPLRPAAPPLVLVQRWIFGPVLPGRRLTSSRPAPHVHLVG